MNNLSVILPPTSVWVTDSLWTLCFGCFHANKHPMHHLLSAQLDLFWHKVSGRSSLQAQEHQNYMGISPAVHCVTKLNTTTTKS